MSNDHDLHPELYARWIYVHPKLPERLHDLRRREPVFNGGSLSSWRVCSGKNQQRMRARYIGHFDLQLRHLSAGDAELFEHLRLGQLRRVSILRPVH